MAIAAADQSTIVGRDKIALQKLLLNRLPLGKVFEIPPREQALQQVCELLLRGEFTGPSAHPWAVLKVWEELSPIAQKGLSLQNDREALKRYCENRAPEVADLLYSAILHK